MMMVKVKAEKAGREEVKRLGDIFRAKIIDVTDVSYVVELTGSASKLDAFLRTLGEDLIVEVVRSGPSGIARGPKGLGL
jgi:acetolactate synthase-1/3 small subunit